MDVLPRLKLLNVLTALILLLFSLLGHLQPKEFISRKPVQGLNLNRPSISRLEPKMPVRTVNMHCNVRIIYIWSEIILRVYKKEVLVFNP